VRTVNIVQNVNAYLNYIIAAPDPVNAGTPLQWLEDTATCCTYPQLIEDGVSEDKLGKLNQWARFGTGYNLRSNYLREMRNEFT
jgi:hypothetical protein